MAYRKIPLAVLCLVFTPVAVPALTIYEAYEEYREWCEATGDRDYCDIAWDLYYEIQDLEAQQRSDYYYDNPGVGDLTPYTGLGPDYMGDVWGNQGRINSFGLSGN